jgi:Chitin binding Peritrophin-A domain
MKSSVQIFSAIGEWNLKYLMCSLSNMNIITALFLILIGGVFAQKPSCWEFLKDDPDTIDQVYFPHEKNCQFYYQCSSHGPIRMKCQFGMHFDSESHQVCFKRITDIFSLVQIIFSIVRKTWWSAMLISFQHSSNAHSSQLEEVHLLKFQFN